MCVEQWPNFQLTAAQNCHKYAGPIIEIKSMGVIFQKKGKEMLKKGKIFENLGKNAQNLKTFWKRVGDSEW